MFYCKKEFWKNMEFIIIGLLVLIIILLAILLISTTKNKSNYRFLINNIQDLVLSAQNKDKENISQLLEIYSSAQNNNLENLQNMQNSSFINFQNTLSSNQQLLYKIVRDSLGKIDKNLDLSSKNTNFSLENMRKTIEEKLSKIQSENTQKLEEIRITVGDKLQKTLEERLTQSFANVSDNLEKVYKGLGEMQALADGVGDLKKVLSNVKTRGNLGEFQLAAILQEVLSPTQYDTEVHVMPSSRLLVEFAIKLPADDDSFIYLPIDSKFPADKYHDLLDAYEQGNDEKIKEKTKYLRDAVEKAAKDIHDKYIHPPYTTNFAIMFLPFEGLYAEIVKIGMVEILQRKYNVNIAGPTTIVAFLNSLQMGFRTLAIQKRSAEVWKILSAVKTEFNKFDKVLEDTLRNMNSAQNKLSELIGTRTNQIKRKLKDVTVLENNEETSEILQLENTDESI